MNEPELFVAVVGIADPAERAAFLDRECSDRPDLRMRMEQLIEAHLRSNALLDSLTPAAHRQDPAALGPTANFAPDMVAGALIAGRYKLLQQIGEGGMGAVWMADQTEPVKRRVAVKLIRVDRGQSKMILSRFEAERQAIALMDHPHIAKLLDAGTTETGSPFFVMELVKGKPLTDFCDEYRLGIPERLRLFAQVCSAVQHAHQKGVIHRDLKPTNILVESHDGKPVPKVIDFGLAKATTGLQLTEHTLFTAFGSVMGTPLYMAPEQATFNAVDVDTRADVYALGVILYELLTGATPLTREAVKKAQLDELFRLIREQDAPTPSSRLSNSDSAPSIAANRQMEPAKLGRFLRGELDWIVLKALSKERDRRYETALGFARDIERFLTHEPVAAGPPTAGYRVRKFVQRNRGKVMAAGLVALTLVLGVAGTTWGLISARQSAAAEKRANEQTKKRLAQIEKGVELFAGMLKGIDPRHQEQGGDPLYVQLRQRAEKAADELNAEAVGDPLAMARLQTNLGDALRQLGSYAKAIALTEKARATRERELETDHYDTLDSSNSLALAYHAAGQLDKAVPLFEATLKAAEAKLGLDHTATLKYRRDLASAYLDAGQLNKALPLFEATLKGYEAKWGADHVNTEDSRDSLALAYQRAGQLDKALPMFEASFKATESKRGAAHASTLIVRHNLALAYQEAGQLDKALPLFEANVRATEAKLGTEHPQTLARRNSLAVAYQDAKQLDKAVPLLVTTLKATETKLGPDHPDTMASRNNLAVAYQYAGQLDKALPLLVANLKIVEAKHGADHPHTLKSRNNLAAAYHAARQYDKALPMFDATLKATAAKLGADHPETLLGRNNLAQAYMSAGQRAKALPLFEQAAAGMERHRFQHAYAKPIINGAIVAYEQAGQLDKAVGWRRKWLTVVKEKSGADSPAHAGELAALGTNLLQQKKWTDAEPVLRECLTIREQKQPHDWRSFNTQSLLGAALSGQKKYSDAEPLLLKGYEGLKTREKTIPPQGSTRIPEALDRLIDLYTATNKPAEIKKWKAERAKLPPPAANPKSSK